MNHKGYDQPEIARGFWGKFQKLVFNKIAMTGAETIPAIGAGFARLSFQDIFFVQGIVRTLRSTDHTLGATLLNGNPEKD